MELRLRGLLSFLGLLLIVGGGAVAGAQFANLDLSPLDSVNGAKAFLLSPTALYAGGGAAGFGLLLIIVAAATGGKKKAAKTEASPTPALQRKASEKTPQTDASLDSDAAPLSPPVRTPAPEAPRVAVRPAEAPRATAPQKVTATSDQPPWSQPASKAASQLAPVTSAKPTASAQPPEDNDPLIASRSDPRLLNRKRVTDLVSINDALKAYHAQHGGYPKAEGLLGLAERGETWIPGLAPEFMTRLPRDPATVSGQSAQQYVYASDGRNYKLLAQGVSLLGGTNVEVLGVRIDPTRKPTADNAAFGFWTPEFASA